MTTTDIASVFYCNGCGAPLKVGDPICTQCQLAVPTTSIAGAAPEFQGPKGLGGWLLFFWPSGFERFLEATAVPAPDNAVAPTGPPAAAIRNVHELAGEYGILFG